MIALAFSIAMIFYSCGEILSKYWGEKQSIILAISINIFYSLGVICWLYIMAKKNQLALMSSIWQILTTIATLFIGLIIFHEKLTNLQYAGVGLMILGIIALAVKF